MHDRRTREHEFAFPGGPDLGDEPGGFWHGRPGMGAPPFGPRRMGGRAGRARRGDVRSAALALLAQEPMNGYQIIQQIGERSGGLWRASPGSVYPALAQLEDENLIALASGERGRRAYELTDEGRAYVAEHAERLMAPWSDMTDGAAGAAVDMRSLVGQLHLAAIQVASAGTQAQLAQARDVLTQARRALYRILAEEDTPAPDGQD